MIADNLVIIDGYKDLPLSSLKTLFYFYAPLIKEDALLLYEYLLLKREETKIATILTELNFSLTRFINALNSCNEFKLIKTFKHKDCDSYLLEVLPVLSIKAFCANQVYLRLLEKVIGKEELNKRLQNNLKITDTTIFNDVSKTLTLPSFDNWQDYLADKEEKDINLSANHFDIALFVREASTILFPSCDHNERNYQAILSCAKIYNINEEKMRDLLAKMYNRAKCFDSNLLFALASRGNITYRQLRPNEYDVSPVLFLMNKQQGREVTEFDKIVINKLIDKYHLKPSVINVLIEHSLKRCDNRLIGNYVYPLASDLYRNNIDDELKAKDFLNRENNLKKANIKKVYKNSNYRDVLPVYDASKNPKMSKEQEKELEERVKRLLEGSKK